MKDRWEDYRFSGTCPACGQTFLRDAYSRGEQAGYDRGYDEGHTIGFAEGYEAAIEKSKQILKETIEEMLF